MMIVIDVERIKRNTLSAALPYFFEVGELVEKSLELPGGCQILMRVWSMMHVHKMVDLPVFQLSTTRMSRIVLIGHKNNESPAMEIVATQDLFYSLAKPTPRFYLGMPGARRRTYTTQQVVSAILKSLPSIPSE